MAEFLTLAFGLLATPFISWLKACAMPDWLKILIALIVSAFAGLATVAVAGELDLRNVAYTSTAVFTVATVFFHAYFKKTLLNENLEERKVL